MKYNKKYSEKITDMLDISSDDSQFQLIYKKITSNLKKNTRFKFIDLFAGVGGIRIPFEENNGECVFTSEWDANCQKTYFANFGEVPYGDINSINAKDIPEHDILLAGFPCQAFSIAGYRKGFEDTRGTLFFNIAEILKEHNPAGFLLENVKGLVNHQNGKTFKRIIEVLDKDLDYQVFPQILNSMTHAGIPQNRERIIIVGVKKELYIKGITKSVFMEFPLKAVPLAKTIHDFIDKDKKSEKYYYRDHQYFDKLNIALKSKDTIYQWRRHYVRENKNNVCPTLTANMGTGGHNVPIIRDEYGIRKLTPRECARFQGFTEDFIFPNKLPDSKLYYQVGNSVTIPLIRRVANNLINYLIKLNAFSVKTNSVRQRQVS